VHYTLTYLSDFTLNSAGIAIGLFDRLELSYAHQSFDTRAAGGRLGLGRNFTFDTDVYGAKVRVWGNAVYDQDRLLPQIASRAIQDERQPGIIARSAARTATASISMSAPTRSCSARACCSMHGARDQGQPVRHPGVRRDKNNDYTAQFEGSAALLLSRQLRDRRRAAHQAGQSRLCPRRHGWRRLPRLFLHQEPFGDLGLRQSRGHRAAAKAARRLSVAAGRF